MNKHKEVSPMLFKKNDIIVLQGDSITDAGRTNPQIGGYGAGYAAMCANALQALYPDYNLTVYNRGIGGNRVEHLVSRWNEDCIDLKPNVVSLFIGINNVWHPYVNDEVPYDIKKFEEDYIRIVERTLATGAKLVILEPFAFHHAVLPEAWRERLWEINQVVRKIALRYADAYIPLDGLFYQAALNRSAADLSADGVHPTPDGHRLIAGEWLKAVGAL